MEGEGESPQLSIPSQRGEVRQDSDSPRVRGHAAIHDADASSSSNVAVGSEEAEAAAANRLSTPAQDHAPRTSFTSLWGSIKPQQSSVAVAAGFPRQVGLPLGCAVLRASDDVRSGSDSPPVMGFGSFGSSFEAHAGFGAHGGFGGYTGFGGPGRFAGMASFGGPARFGTPAEFGSLGRLGLAGVSGAPRTAGRSEGFSAFQQSMGPLGEDKEAIEGWGASGWGGDSVGVKKTSGDAASSKLSASLLGYFPDEFLKHFVTQPIRMQPLINRGYYSRVEAIRRLIASFLEDAANLAATRKRGQSQHAKSTAGYPTESVTVPHEHQRNAGVAAPPVDGGLIADAGPVAQFVNIGAGADTTAFFLAHHGGAIVFDLDFPDVCREKAAVIQRVPELRECLGEACEAPIDDPSVMRTTKYRLVAVDMRNVGALKVAMEKAGLRKDLPTLFLCECVLIYLRVEEADAVVRWAAEAVPLAPSALVIYEQFNPDDPFGRVMVRNLQAAPQGYFGVRRLGAGVMQMRNCPLLTIKRFAEHGWPQCSLADMRSVYENFLPKAERERVQALEIFDELEEWWLIQSHYFLGVLLRPAPPQAGGATLASLVDALSRRP